MQQFIQRIFAQSVQSQIESLLSQAESCDTIVYLCVLASTHAATQSLVSKLQVLDETEIRPMGGGGLGVSNVLDRAFSDLFVPYVEADRYFALEVKFWTSRIDAVLLPFRVYIADRDRALTKRGRSTNIHTQVSPTRIAEKSLREKMLGGGGGGGTTGGDEQVQERPLTEDEQGIVCLGTVVTLMKRHVEAVFRCRQLVPAGMLYVVKSNC